MSNPQLDPTPSAPRSLDDWTALVAAGALVLGGFLISIAAPTLRKLYDRRTAELAEAREAIDGLLAGAPELDAERQAGEPDGDGQAEADASRPDAGDVWSSADLIADDAGGLMRGAGLNGGDPATDPIGAGDG